MKTYLFFFLLFFHFNSSAQNLILNGYADKDSYFPNETILFFLSGVSGTHNNTQTNEMEADPLNVMDMNGNIVLSFPINVMQELTLQNINSNAPWVNGFGFQLTCSLSINNSLPSGRYLLENTIPFVVKNSSNNLNIQVLVSTNTDQAYNIGVENTGPNVGLGKNFYSPADFGGHDGHILSFNRTLIDYEEHHFMDGFLKWMPNQGYSNVGYICDKDMDDFSNLDKTRLLIIIGHSEYWTKEARLNFDRFVLGGGHALILSGNTMCWQVRYRDDPNNPNNPQIICFQNHSVDLQEDPACDPRKSYYWQENTLGYACMASIGVDWERGILAGRYPARHSFLGFQIIAENSPLLQASNFNNGEVLNLLSDELDGSLMRRNSNVDFVADANGNPIFLQNTLGYYKSEVIGYEIGKENLDIGPKEFIPWLVFQRTCSSGVTINIPSTEWCSLRGMGPGPEESPHANEMKLITGNMINALLGPNPSQGAFSSGVSQDDGFTLAPNPNIDLSHHSDGSIGYRICQNEELIIDPCGIHLENGTAALPVQNHDNEMIFEFTTCNNCREAEIGENYSSVDNSNNRAEDTLFNLAEYANPQVYPNPTNDELNVLKGKNNNEQAATFIFKNVLGETIWTKVESSFLPMQQFSLKEMDSGIYFLEIIQGEQKFVSKILITRK